MIVRSDHPVTILGGAQPGTDDLAIALRRAPTLVAADGGAGHARAAGHRPVAVIGDMDSLPAAAAVDFADILHPIAEQDSTDFDKVLRSVDAPLAIAVGFSGGRLDHALAVLHGLAARPDRPCIVMGAEDVTVLCPPRIALDLAPGSVCSLFPLAPCGVVSTGLRWPTGGIAFAPDTRIGTSNAVTGAVTLAADAPAMLLIVPRAGLDAVIAGVFAADRWPVRISSSER